jgi:hypothetical protein
VCQAEQRFQAPTVVCNGTGTMNSVHCARKSQSRRQKPHRTVNSDCPVAPLVRAPTVGTQRPSDVAGTPDSVRWRTGLSGAPYDSSLHQRSSWVVGAINTPQPPHFNASKFSAIKPHTRALDFIQGHNQRDQILSQVRNHSKQISD